MGSEGLGSYQDALHGIFTVIGADPVAYTTAGMLYKSDHPVRLVLAATWNTWGVWGLAGRLRTDPALLDDRYWVLREVGKAAGRYLMYPLIAPRRSYWRRPANEAAFFMQTWTGIALCGAKSGPRAACLAGAIYGPALYVLAALLNGEKPPFDPIVRQRLTAFSVSSLFAGAFTASMSKTLTQARKETILQAALAESVKLQKQEEQLALRAVGHLRESFAAIQEAIGIQLNAEQAAAILVKIERGVPAERIGQLSGSDLKETVKDVLTTSASRKGVRIIEMSLTGPLHCTFPSLQAVRLVADCSFDNIRRHARTSSARVHWHADGRIRVLTIEDSGVGMPGPDIKFDPHHALGHASSYLHEIGGRLSVVPGASGGTAVQASWEI